MSETVDPQSTREGAQALLRIPVVDSHHGGAFPRSGWTAAKVAIRRSIVDGTRDLDRGQLHRFRLLLEANGLRLFAGSAISKRPAHSVGVPLDLSEHQWRPVVTSGAASALGGLVAMKVEEESLMKSQNTRI